MYHLFIRSCSRAIKSSYGNFVSVRMASYLINEPKYAFLKELGLAEKNFGVLGRHGDWRGNGELIDSVCPANNQSIASIAQANLADYEHCVSEALEAWKIWADVRLFHNIF